MAGSYSAVDLSKLSPPDLVEELSFETVYQEMLADLISRDPSFSALVESDPANKVLQVCAYREVLVRQRVNDAGRAVMLAYAAGADLDQIGANYNVQRLVIDLGNPDAIPPVEPTYEPDADFRRRIQLALEAITTAGSEGSYIFHALSADGDVKDVGVTSPTPGVVNVYVLSRTGDGSAATELLDAVDAALNAETVRPLTDQVNVLSAAIQSYTIEAELTVYDGPSSEVVRQAALDAVQAYAAEHHAVGHDITLSGLYAALHQPGVQSVNLISPSASVVCSDSQAAYCTAYDVTVAGVGL